jgi:alkylresorcinol/alkylpyrone synthase
MSKVVSVGIADVPYKFHQSEVKDFIYHQLLLHSREDVERIINVFDNSTIEWRRFTQPREWFYQTHSFKERNEQYIKAACSLSVTAIKNCIERINAELSDFDHIIFVSSTGIATPSVDALVINELKLDAHLKRTPIWGLGCAGGAAGLSRAFEYTRAFPKSAVLLVTLEICSLSFHKDDYSKSNIIAYALFSDGAAATLVAGREHRLSNLTGINLIDSLSTIYYNSLDIMGWEVLDNGFKAIFSKDIPTIVRKQVRPNIEELLERHNLTLSDIKHFIAHPGGLKVINEYEKSLGVENGTLKFSRKVLSEYGNMSSPTVLYVLKEFLDDRKYSSGDYGLISALGPGFSSELVLFQVA